MRQVAQLCNCATKEEESRRDAERKRNREREKNKETEREIAHTVVYASAAKHATESDNNSARGVENG